MLTPKPALHHASAKKLADVCLILEGTYPYVTGGVSSWTQDLLIAQSHLTFHLVTLLPRNADLTLRYKIPANVLSTSQVVIQELPEGGRPSRQVERLFHDLESPLSRLQARGGLADLVDLLNILRSNNDLGGARLLNSEAAWNMLVRMYNHELSHTSFLDYFWSWRALLGGLYSVLLADIPPAKVYHSVSTGYAGLFIARAHAETGRPVLLTEHGIYTNERRIEMAMANWLHDAPMNSLQVDAPRRMLKDLWVDTFIGYSRACYEAASEIITLYAGNQQFQINDGAPQEKLRIIPNGIDFDRYSAVARDPLPHPPTVALIGRVVPIKDVKTFIRSIALLRASIPDVRALILGPTDEEPDYFSECAQLVHHFGLQDTIEFTGRVRLDDYLGKIDVVVLTSLSEAQPLVILEAGAAGIPIVATEVGACREMILGRDDEEPKLGAGGAVTALCNPSATSHELAKLLTNREWYDKCGSAIRERARTQYNKAIVDQTYQVLYERYIHSWPESASNCAN